MLPGWKWFVDNSGPGNRIWLTWDDSEAIEAKVRNVARRILGSACAREEGRETVSRGGDSHTIDMDTTRTDNPISNVDQLLHIVSTLSLPRITSSSVDNLVEYSTIPEAAIVENIVPLLLALIIGIEKEDWGIRALIASKKHMNQKEQVHSSKMDHCSLPASTKEHYVTLSIPDYISGWKAEVIGTILTTLNVGSIVLTFFPNFAISLCDPHVASALQIMGANQVPASVMATLHHQLIPRQISRKDLEKLVPTEWITNYELLQQQHETITSTDFQFKRLPDGRVKTIFETQPAGEPSNPDFQLMITPIPVLEEIITPIDSFGADGHRIYTDWMNGHFIWDVDLSMCDPECSCEEESDDNYDDYVWSDYESDEDDDFSSCNDCYDDYDEPDPNDRPSFRTPQHDVSI
ncbi:UNVERIFIED_CONTAM: polyprotein [Sesamum latifolium]|uniref:Polyprotein n=1 Tax=Sesamum latifolium TaxID=2727402 RepID=A0AAW2XPI7_9LAMI